MRVPWGMKNAYNAVPMLLGLEGGSMSMGPQRLHNLRHEDASAMIPKATRMHTLLLGYLGFRCECCSCSSVVVVLFRELALGFWST